KVGAFAGQFLGIGEFDDAQLTLGAGAGCDGAISANCYVGFFWTELDRAARAENGIGGEIDQSAVGADLECAGAGPAFAAGSLYGKEAFAAESYVKRIAGLQHGSNRQIMDGCPVLHIGERLIEVREGTI